ncbi:hypothetical protein [Streptomyces sp. NPDC057496]|uniref:hypothetical protein n=1 Tax=Streptomyces sp. NPDC057496 TaxID=3346149 RepID=UPI0036977E66
MAPGSMQRRGPAEQATTDRGEDPAGALTTAGREEPARLRRKAHEQEQTIEVQGKEAAFFANHKTRQT